MKNNSLRRIEHPAVEVTQFLCVKSFEQRSHDNFYFDYAKELFKEPR